MNALTRLLTVAAVLAVIQLQAAEPKAATPEHGKSLLSEDFSKAIEPAAKATKGKAAAASWRMAKGKWETVDGALKGSELKEDKHPAVARHPLVFKDVVIQYEVQVNGCRMTTLSVNDAKGHICRVLINADGFTAQKDDHDHDGPDKGVKFGTEKLAIKAGEWKTVTVEIKGEEMTARIDDKVIKGKHAALAVEKADLGFTVAGESASFRNLKVWEAVSGEAPAKAKVEPTTAAK